MIIHPQTALDRLFRILNPQTTHAEEFVSLDSQDWDNLLVAASQQGLSLLLYDRLSSPLLKELVPEPVQGSLRETYLQVTARNMVMLHHAKALLEELRGRGIEVIALKGLYLAEKVYTGIGLRTFGDIDLLLHRPDLPAALEIMRDLGYELSTWYDPADANIDIKHLPPLIKTNAPVVELHWTILEEDKPFTIDVDALWARSVPVDIAGVNVRGLGVEDLLLHLGLHLTYQHRLAAGVRNLYDIDAVIRREVVDWQQLVATAHLWHAERVTWLTLRLLEDIAETPLPDDVFTQLIPSQPDPVIVVEAKQQLLTGTTGDLAMTPDLAALSETRGLLGKLRLAVRRVFIPRRVLGREYNVNPQNPKIFLYYFLRFFRLLRNYRGTATRLMWGEEAASQSAQLERDRKSLNQWLAGK